MHSHTHTAPPPPLLPPPLLTHAQSQTQWRLPGSVGSKPSGKEPEKKERDRRGEEKKREKSWRGTLWIRRDFPVFFFVREYVWIRLSAFYQGFFLFAHPPCKTPAISTYLSLELNKRGREWGGKTVTASAPDHPLSSSTPLPPPSVFSPVPHPCVSSSLISVSFEDRARRTPCVLQDTAGLPLGSGSSSDLREGKKQGGLDKNG